MTDALDQNGCIRHRNTARFITYYEDYQEMSEKNPDKLAAFLRILEVKTTKKLIAFEGILEDAVNNGRDIPDLNLWLEISYNDFVYWSLKTMGRSSFQVADKEAESMMLAKSRVCYRPIRPDDPESPKVQYKEYLLVIENVQAKIDGKELPIAGKAFEEYGNVPPVFKNIPMLRETWDVLQKTRDSLLQKTYPPVVKNRFINNSISNYSKQEEKTTTDAVASQQSQPSSQKKVSSSGKPPREKKPEPPKQPELPRLEEPDLTHLLEQEVQIYNNLLRKEDQPKYLAWAADKRNVYNNLLGKYGYTVPINITPKVDECMGQLKDEKPTVETFKAIDKYAHKNDQFYPNGQKKPLEKQFYKGRGLKPWDYVREYASWKSQMGIMTDGEGPSTGKLPSQVLTHDDAQKLAIDAVEQGKQHGYDIKANAYANGDKWMVNIVWDGFSVPVNTRAEWEANFKENLEYDQRKGAK